MDNDIKNGILTNNKYMIEQGVNKVFSTLKFVIESSKEYCQLFHHQKKLKTPSGKLSLHNILQSPELPYQL